MELNEKKKNGAEIDILVSGSLGGADARAAEESGSDQPDGLHPLLTVTVTAFTGPLEDAARDGKTSKPAVVRTQEEGEEQPMSLTHLLLIPPLSIHLSSRAQRPAQTRVPGRGGDPCERDLHSSTRTQWEHQCLG